MLKVATVFSGIGAIEHALKRMDISHEIIFSCDIGDVDILSKNIENDLISISDEIDSLHQLINQIKVKSEEDTILMYQDLLKISKNFHTNKVLLHEIKDDFINICIGILNILVTDQNIKKTKSKEYQKNLNDISIPNQEAKIFNSIKFSIKIINDFLKSNDLSLLQSQTKSDFISKNNIIWKNIYEDLLQLYQISEKYEFKKHLKTFKLISEQLSMLYERINTYHITKDINNLKTSVEKKNYVDKLYEKKISQNKVKQSYMANYDISDEQFHWNISFLDGTQYKDKVDLFVGGSPCQSFSLVGKQRGLEDTRGTLFYEYARLIKEINPKVFIYENVKAVLSNDSGKTWSTMQKVFTELDYTWTSIILNAKDYGIPQNRERLFVVGFRNDLILKKEYTPPTPIKLDKALQDFLLDNVSGKYYLHKKGVAFITDQKNLSKKYTQIDGKIQLCQKKNQQFNWHGDFIFVEEEKNKNIEKTMQELEKYFLSEKVEKYVLSSGTKGFYSKPKTDLKVARPLLTTMHKMHRAGIDNYVTTQGKLRKLTPRECLRLMGFCDSFKIVVSDTSMYQQAGNSIVVDVLISIMTQIIKSYPNLIIEE